ncbi:MAG: ABC-type glycerol-3-phosphate transport system permease component [Pirellulaceae bacterium]
MTGTPHNQQNTQLTQILTDHNVIPKLLIKSLVIALPILLVAFAVVIGGYALAANTEDWTANFLWYLGMTILALLATNTVLLVGTLGLRALEEDEARVACASGIADQPSQPDSSSAQV